MNEAQSFSGAEFFEKLLRDELTNPIMFTGMVKKAEDDSEYLMFAHGTQCLFWMKIPVSVIERVEVLQTIPCDDHTHPYVNLYFRQPESAEGQLFSALAQASSRSQSPHMTTQISQPQPCGHRSGLLPLGAIVQSERGSESSLSCGSATAFSSVCTSGCQCKYPT